MPDYLTNLWNRYYGMQDPNSYGVQSIDYPLPSTGPAPEVPPQDKKKFQLSPAWANMPAGVLPSVMPFGGPSAADVSPGAVRAGLGMIGRGVGAVGSAVGRTAASALQPPQDPADTSDSPSERTGRFPQGEVKPDAVQPLPPPIDVPDRPVRDVDGGPTGQPGQSVTPKEAAPAEGQLPQGQVAPGAMPQAANQAGFLGSLGDFGAGIMPWLRGHSNELGAMAAGFLGAPTLGIGASRAFSYGTQGNEMDYKRAMEGQSQGAMYTALKSAGAPEAMARAGSMNPDIGKAMLGTYIAPKYDVKEVKTKNWMGQESTELVAVDSRDPRNNFSLKTGQPYGAGAVGGRRVGGINAQGNFLPATPADAQRIGGGGGPAPAPSPFSVPVGGTVPGPGGPAPAAAGGGGVAAAGAPQGAPAPPAGGGGPQDTFYAPGVTDENVDWNKNGEDFLNQFSPIVKDYVTSRAQGLIPSGRAAGFGPQMTGPLNMIANKYGLDIGHPIDDNAFRERSKYMTGLADTKSGTGAQIDGFHKSLNHFTEISDNLVKMKLSNGFNAPGGEKTAEYINWFKSLTPDQKRLINRNDLLAGYLGRELGRMAGGSSVSESTHTARALGGGFQSGKAAAGALESARDILQGNLDSMITKRDSLFPDQRFRPQGTDFFADREKAQLDHLQHNIDILSGEAPRDREAAPASTPPPAGPAKLQWSIVR